MITRWSDLWYVLLTKNVQISPWSRREAVSDRIFGLMSGDSVACLSSQLTGLIGEAAPADHLGRMQDSLKMRTMTTYGH